MLVGRRAQLGLASPAKAGRNAASKSIGCSCRSWPMMMFAGLQVAVGAVVGDHAGGQGVERFLQAPELRRIAREGGFGDRFVEGRAVDPVAQNRIDPDACFRRSVEVELFFEHPPP